MKARQQRAPSATRAAAASHGTTSIGERRTLAVAEETFERGSLPGCSGLEPILVPWLAAAAPVALGSQKLRKLPSFRQIQCCGMLLPLLTADQLFLTTVQRLN